MSEHLKLKRYLKSKGIYHTWLLCEINKVLLLDDKQDSISNPMLNYYINEKVGRNIPDKFKKIICKILKQPEKKLFNSLPNSRVPRIKKIIKSILR